MENMIRIFGALLALQILLVALSLVGGERYQAFEASEPLLALQQEEVDAITIEEPERAPLRLERSGEEWQLPSLDGFPASSHSITRLLDKLVAMKRGWPVAESASAADRFEVTEEEFERKITLHGDDGVLGTLYLGTSPGLRKVHARVAGEEAIHTVEFNSYEAGAAPGDWIDEGLLRLTPEEIERIALPDLVLLAEDDKMVVEGLESGEQLQQEEVEKLVKRVAELDIQSVQGSEEVAAQPLDEPLFRFSVGLKSGETREYRLYSDEGSADYLLTVSNHDHRFKVASWNIDPIREADRAKLVVRTVTEPVATVEVAPEPAHAQTVIRGTEAPLGAPQIDGQPASDRQPATPAHSPVTGQGGGE